MLSTFISFQKYHDEPLSLALMNNVFFEALLLLHVFAGVIGLVAGTINILGPKTGRVHKNVGLWFTFAMSFSCLLAIILSSITGNIFLLSTGVFTLYLTGTGYRAHKHFRRRNPMPIQRPDWLLTGGMVIAAIFLTGTGLRALLHESVMGVVPLVFTAIGLLGVRTDIRLYRKPPEDRLVWLRVHLGRMTGAYIAAFTAFLVNNAYRFGFPGPAVIWWLAPTALLVPFIVRWSRRYQRKV